MVSYRRRQGENPYSPSLDYLRELFKGGSKGMKREKVYCEAVKADVYKDTRDCLGYSCDTCPELKSIHSKEKTTQKVSQEKTSSKDYKKGMRKTIAHENISQWKIEHQKEELIFYGETLNNPKKIIKERNLLLKWFLNQTYQNPDLTINKAVLLFAKERPWGNKKSSLASDLKALYFAFLSIFSDPTGTPSYEDEVSKTDFGERLKIYQEYYDHLKYHPEDAVYVSKEQFEKTVRLQSEWDTSFGKEFEELIKTNFTNKHFANFYERAEPLFKQLKRAYSEKVCEAHGCMDEIPIGRKDRKHCCEKCRQAEKSRRFRENNPDVKREADKKYWATVKHDEDGITENDYQTLLKGKKMNKP